MAVTTTWITDLICILLALATFSIYWIKKKLNYWKQRRITNPETTFLFGNMLGLFKQSETFSEHVINIYNHFKSKNLQHGGEYFLLMPIYIPIAPDLIKHIMQNDFSHFVDRGLYVNEKTDPLTANLFFIEGVKWKNLRAKLTPTFTSGKMKMMFEILIDCSKELLVQMDSSLSAAIDIKDILGRFTTDTIGSCAFGIQCNSLKNPNSDFRKYAQSFFHSTVLENIKSIFTYTMPEVMRVFGTKMIRTDVNDFFMNAVKETVDFREQNNYYRKDFMQLLIQLKNTGKLDEDIGVSEGENLSFNELAAQAFVFFVAGFETSSTTMTFCLYELASNPEIQEMLREEINRVVKNHDGKITYDSIMEMSYLDKVLNETLRKYPPLPSLNRICTKDYIVPGTDVVIEKGTKVNIPVYGLQMDEEYYPDPTKFDPERFSEENKRSRPPYTFLPFGDGPRNCIGERFGKMQSKVGITVLIQNYKFTVSNKTKVPLKMDPISFILTTHGGMWLDCVKI